MTLPMASLASFTTTKRWIPLALIVCLMIAAYALGLHEQLSLQSIAAHREELRQFIADNLASGPAHLWLQSMSVAVALSISGAGTSHHHRRSVVWLARWCNCRDHWRRHGSHDYLSGSQLHHLKNCWRASPALVNKDTERVLPGTPSTICCSCDWCRSSRSGWSTLPPLLPTSDSKHLSSATFFGIIPVTTAFSFVGASFDSVIDAQKAAHETCLAQGGSANCPFDFSADHMLTPQILIALAALGILALIPVVLKRLGKSHDL